MIPVIAIDGPSGVGKSSVARKLAGKLGWTYLDTGAMYRAATLAWLQAGRNASCLTDQVWLQALDLAVDGPSITLYGEDVAEAIRSPEVTRSVSQVSAAPLVRRRLTEMQRRLGARAPSVLEGRDIGTVVFPDAFFKVFLTASDEVRAKRRWLQIGGERSGRTLAQVLAEQQIRDKKDSQRAVAPLRRAEDAFQLETDRLTEDRVVASLRKEVERRLASLDLSDSADPRS